MLLDYKLGNILNLQREIKRQWIVLDATVADTASANYHLPPVCEHSRLCC